MNTGLKVAYLWHDTDVIEVRVTAENEAFRGVADVYVGTGGLIEAAASLVGFPKNYLDKREVIFGAAGRKFAGGFVHLAFYCEDMAGHAAFRATIEADYGEPETTETATVCVHFDPAALDEFLRELHQVETERRGFASMMTAPS